MDGEISLAEVVDYWADVQDMVLADMDSNWISIGVERLVGWGTFSPFSLDIIDEQARITTGGDVVGII